MNDLEYHVDAAVSEDGEKKYMTQDGSHRANQKINCDQSVMQEILEVVAKIEDNVVTPSEVGKLNDKNHVDTIVIEDGEKIKKKEEVR